MGLEWYVLKNSSVLGCIGIKKQSGECKAPDVNKLMFCSLIGLYCNFLIHNNFAGFKFAATLRIPFVKVEPGGKLFFKPISR